MGNFVEGIKTASEKSTESAADTISALSTMTEKIGNVWAIDAIMKDDFAKARKLYEEADHYSDELIGDLKKLKAIAENN